jgi:hypothetical protein
MSSIPSTASSFAGGGCKYSLHFNRGAPRASLCYLIQGLFTFPTRDYEAAINDSWTKEPLRHQIPYSRGNAPAEEGLKGAAEADFVLCVRRGGEVVCGLEDDQRCKSDRQPYPADFDEVEIEDIVFAREVVDWALGEVEVSGEGGC